MLIAAQLGLTETSGCVRVCFNGDSAHRILRLETRTEFERKAATERVHRSEVEHHAGASSAPPIPPHNRMSSKT